MQSFERFAQGFLCIFMLLLLAGCGPKEKRVSVYPVKGKVLFRGAPAEGADITFHNKMPLEELKAGGYAILANGKVQSDGSYQITSYEANDGAAEGEYKITIVWNRPKKRAENEGEPDPEADFEPQDAFQGRYQNPETSPLSAKIQATDENIVPDINLK